MKRQQSLCHARSAPHRWLSQRKHYVADHLGGWTLEACHAVKYGWLLSAPKETPIDERALTGVGVIAVL